MRRIVCVAVAVLTLGAGAAAAQVCDLVEVTTVPASGSLSQPTILGTTAYVAGGSAGIVRFNVNLPTRPFMIDATPTGGQAMDLGLDFLTSMLLVANGTAGVRNYQIDATGLPVPGASLDLGGTIISLVGSATQFVAGSQEGTIYTLAEAGPGVALEGSLAVGGQVRGLALQGSRVFCALGSAGLAMVGLSDRTTPQLVTTVDLGGAVVSVVRDGDLLFCGVDQIGLVSVRIGDDTLLPASSLAMTAAPTRTVAWGGRLYMVGPELGVAEADASLGSDVLLLSRLDLAGANGLALSGNYLFVGRGTQGFAVIDASDCAQSGVLPTTRFISAAARATGAVNTHWVTDMAIANLTSGVATCNIAYLAKNQENSSPLNLSIVLEAGQQQLIQDVFSTLFSLDSANGALRITASHPDVKTTSRTYNAAGANGTYGQFIPSLTRDQALVPGVSGGLLQLQENQGFRTNLGVLNITELTTTVEIDLYLGSGNLVGVRTETLLPYEMIQIDRIFNTVGAGTVDSGFAVVKVQTSGGKVMAYASVVDNVSGDPIFIPAQMLVAGSSFP